MDHRHVSFCRERIKNPHAATVASYTAVNTIRSIRTAVGTPAQQPPAEPCSVAATQTLDGRQLPPEPKSFGGVISPFDQRPIGMGFEYFYGFVSGETNQWQPDLYRNTTRVYPYVGKPDYNLTTDMADDAIAYLHQINELDPNKPFFMHYASGTEPQSGQTERDKAIRLHKV